MQSSHGEDIEYHLTVKYPAEVVVIEARAVEELLLASHAQLREPMFAENFHALYERLLEAQDKARQALKWGEYAEKRS